MALDTLVTGSKLTAIANAIRTKGGTQAQLTLDQMPQAVADLPSGGGGDTVSPFLEQALKNLGDNNANPHDIDLTLAAWGDTSPYSGGAAIRDYAFYNTSVNLGAPARRLGDVTIPQWIKTVGVYAFHSAGVENVTFAGSSTDYRLELQGENFSDQPSLVSVKGSRRLTFSGTKAFASCTGLREVDITLSPWSYVYRSTFYNCTSLGRVILRGGHINSIESAAFSNCTALSELVIDEVVSGSSASIVTLAADALTNVPQTCRIYVPDLQVDAYKAATNWSTRADYIFPLSDFVEA